MKNLGKFSTASFIRVLLSFALCVQILILIFGAASIISFNKQSPGSFKYINHKIPVELTKTPCSNIVEASDTISFLTPKVRLYGGTLIFRSPDRMEMLFYTYSGGTIKLLSYILITYILIVIFKTLEESNPFTNENSKRIRAIGYIVFFMLSFDFLRHYFIHEYINQHFQFKNTAIKTTYIWDGISLPLIFVIFIIAEIFRIGARLKEEQDLTV